MDCAKKLQKWTSEGSVNTTTALFSCTTTSPIWIAFSDWYILPTWFLLLLQQSSAIQTNAVLSYRTNTPNYSSQFIQNAADNVDHNIKTLDGNNTLKALFCLDHRQEQHGLAWCSLFTMAHTLASHLWCSFQWLISIPATLHVYTPPWIIFNSIRITTHVYNHSSKKYYNNHTI